MLLKSTLITSAVSIIVAVHAATIIAPSKRIAKSLSGTFVHITDFHLDPYYIQGATVSSVCHRKRGDTDKGLAGRFGALGSDCDSPLALVDATFEFLKNHASDADFVVYTGDSVRHNRDKSMQRTEKEVQSSQELIVKYFTDTFSSKVIPVIGNNDVKTHNSLGAYDKQYPMFEKLWAPLDLDLGPDFKQGGYYVQDITPNLRTINMNTMVFLQKNKLVEEDCDVAGLGRTQLNWLKKTLSQTKKQNAKAYILAHVPPNSKNDKHFYKPECYNEYYSILGSYSDVILAHFSGHFNYDQLTAVLQDKSDGTYTRVPALGSEDIPMTSAELEQYNVVGALFNAPSVVPQQNPAVRIYTYDTEGKKHPYGTILDWDQYYADLEEANKSGTLTYKLEYKASKLYNVSSFDAKGLHSVFRSISLNKNVQQKYNSFRSVSVNKAD